MSDPRQELIREFESLEGPPLEELSIESTADAIDDAVNRHSRELAVDVANRRTEKGKAILKALEKIEWGIYGKCEECGEEIADKRLSFVPSTPYCLMCQINKEKESV